MATIGLQRLFLVALLGLTACAGKRTTDVGATTAAVRGPVDPSQALATLEEGAADLDVSIRARALSLLIITDRTPGAGQWGARAVWDPNPWVQKRGVEALASRLPEAESAALLGELAKRRAADPYVRGAAAMKLATTGDTTTAQAMTAAYQAERSLWKAAPLALAAARMGDENALEILERALRNGELPLDLDFMVDIGDSGLTQLVPALIEATELAEEPLLIPLAAALVELGSAHGETIFRDALSSPTIERRLEAIDFLVELDAPAATALLKRASATGPEFARKYASFGLLAHGRGDIGKTAGYALNDADREVRALAVRCLGLALIDARAEGLQGRQVRVAHRTLLRALQDPEDMVLGEAVRALARTGAPEDAGSLGGLLEAEALALRVEAAGAVLAIAPGS